MYCTGLPCPTTGVTRSLLSLRELGRIRDFFLFNPLTSAYVALAAATALALLRRCLGRRPLVLPTVLGWSWLACLALGWLAKFALGKAYW